MKCSIGSVLLAVHAPYTDPDEPLAPGQQPLQWAPGEPMFFAQFVDQRDGGSVKMTVARGFSDHLQVGDVYNLKANMTFEAAGRTTKTKFRLLQAQKVAAPAPVPAPKTPVAA